MKDLTELVFILDRSGSMSGLEKDTIGGFNSLIEKQKREKGDAIVTTILFNNTSKVLYNRVDLKDVKPLTENDYVVYGGTALVDAVGIAISQINRIHMSMKKEEVPEKTLFVITTDGEENSSSHYTYREVFHMIQNQKFDHNWEFLFLGATIDIVEEAEKIGISKENAVAYNNDSVGTALNYDVLNETISDIRKNKKLSKNWKKKIEEDYENRK